MHVPVETKTKLNALRYENEEKALNYSKKEEIVIKVDRWMTEKTKTVDFLWKVHLT